MTDDIQPDLFLPFGGKTYVPALDHARLANALGRVYLAMSDGQWHSLKWLAEQAGCSEAGASARVRDLRKPAFRPHYPNGGIQSKRSGTGTEGLWVYRMLPPG